LWAFGLCAFDELAAFEAGAGAHQGDEVGCVDRAPPVLGGLDELERHRKAGGLGAGPLGDLRVFTQPYLLAQSRLNTSSGGPENSMLSYSMYLFQNAFVYLKMGYASAMAWVLFLITMAVTALILLNAKRWVHDGSR
jgi:hypothetical protein